MRGRVVCVDAGTIVNGQPKLVWEKTGITAGLASPLLHEGRLYAPDEGATLYCLDGKTGQQLWRFKYGRVSRGAPVWADGKIYVADVNAHFHILKPEDKRCREVHNQFFASTDRQGFVEINGTPAVTMRSGSPAVWHSTVLIMRSNCIPLH